MDREVYYRDPGVAGDLQGPFTVAQFEALARDGILRPTDQVSLDRRAWLPAAEFEPFLFGRGPYAFTPEKDWKRTARSLWRRIRVLAVGAWTHLRTAAEFYWSERRTLWQLATEYAPFLKEASDRREIRVSAADENDAVSFDGTQWKAELPDCCVVCGETADGDWNSEQRSVPDLTWPLLMPLNGLLLGLFLWIFFWSGGWGKYLLLVGIFGGFLLGYRLRGETVATVRFRRCRQHLARTKLPRLRTFRNTLVIGVGDRSVWRRFYYGDSGFATPTTVPPDFDEIVDSKRAGGLEEAARPPSPTLPLAADEDDGSISRTPH